MIGWFLVSLPTNRIRPYSIRKLNVNVSCGECSDGHVSVTLDTDLDHSK